MTGFVVVSGFLVLVELVVVVFSVTLVVKEVLVVEVVMVVTDGTGFSDPHAVRKSVRKAQSKLIIVRVIFFLIFILLSVTGDKKAQIIPKADDLCALCSL